MAKPAPVEEKVQIRERVEIEFPRKEVEHMIRCWVDHMMASAPKPQDLASIEIRFHAYSVDDGCGSDNLISATAIYTPAPRT